MIPPAFVRQRCSAKCETVTAEQAVLGGTFVISHDNRLLFSRHSEQAAILKDTETYSDI